MTGPVPVPARSFTIGQDDRAAIERLVASMIDGAAGPQIGFAMHLRLFADSVFANLPPPPENRVIVQEALSLECRREVPGGQEVDITGDRSSTPQAHQFNLVATSLSEPDQPAAALTARLRLIEPEMLAGQAVRDTGRIGDPSLAATISAEHLSAYAVLSGDTNPIHTDRALARSLGLDERVVHGALLAFLVESALSAAGTARVPVKLQMRFLGPACAGETLRFAVNVGTEGRRARVYVIRPNGRICAAADVQLGD